MIGNPIEESLKPEFQFKDVFEFQKIYKTKEQREQALLTMKPEEIMHLARTCGTAQGGAYYGRFAKLAEERDLKKD